MEWDVSLETGIPIVDEQHQSLFRHVAVLLDHSKAGRVRETLAFLDGYVRMHFGTEEVMQKESKYPDASGHKKMHDSFIVVLDELEEEYESGGDGMLVLMEITKVTLDWLKYHIKGPDRDFAKYLKTSDFNYFLVDSDL